jgi:hypothetical protein
MFSKAEKNKQIQCKLYKFRKIVSREHTVNNRTLFYLQLNGQYSQQTWK